ncbi:hypothetical protein BJP36_35670 [Moorena producens JHB]|uniref:Uncharacterized protein n=1 Tax=Moorena producens (strain JHB) TaxID=1454205 RepID=A0A9Q9STN5_MOOP1|nr:hypothetical protein [Moorena producens]WAN69432.1 hypothetical protein BJP36_35670 [Moorena producens JHB]
MSRGDRASLAGSINYGKAAKQLIGSNLEIFRLFFRITSPAPRKFSENLRFSSIKINIAKKNIKK